MEVNLAPCQHCNYYKLFCLFIRRAAILSEGATGSSRRLLWTTAVYVTFIFNLIGFLGVFVGNPFDVVNIR